jgi:nitrous oxidase accessory protein
MHRPLERILACLCVVLALPAWAGQPLQTLIDTTAPGGYLRLAPGEYDGPAVVGKPMQIDGNGRALLRGDGKGTVLTLRASGVVVTGMLISGSGESHDSIDAGVAIEGDDNRIEGNRLDDVLFGIHVKQGNRNRIADNRITGKPLSSGMRGDGLRLWNSRHNVIEENRFERIRDLTFANSPDNRIVGNRVHDGRYGMQFIFSPNAVVERNDLADTATGIVVLYSPGLTIRGNRIAHALDGGGAGIAFKESGEALVEGNEVLHCAAGLAANAPANAEALLTVRGNRFAHNVVGLYFYGEQGGHRIVANRIEHNLSQVLVSAPGAASANVWQHNFWSDYQGFDRNADGIGDTPHEINAYTDRIWMDTPMATFFRNSPALEFLDFLERLAPFAAPTLILRDPRPQMR